MEGVVGSRMSRTSSRYSGPATTAVFSGRVRKWKKKWTRVSTSSVGVFRASKSNGGNDSPHHHLLLHKWTPITLTAFTNGNGETEEEEPPKRRFRYAPIAMLEHREEEEEETDNESPLLKGVVELDMNMTDTDETKEAEAGPLNLVLCLNSEVAEE